MKAGQSACWLRAFGLGVVALAAALLHAGSALAREDRTISFYHIHTKETLTVLYKRNGQYIPDAMKKIDWIMRDWRRNESIKMDPKAIDIIWEMHRELGSQKPVSIISGYRSPTTNNMLRKTRGGQAQRSHHMTGRAIDISFPDVPVRRMRYSAMIRERGGVGYYPTSGIPFVHVDTARVRHWPRMVRDELALLFPSGRTQHVPADGKPIKRGDATTARTRRKDLALEVAQFHAIRDGKVPPAPVQVADAWQTSVAPVPVPTPVPALRPPPPAPERRMAVGAPVPPPAATAPEGMVSLAALSTEQPPPAHDAATPKLVAAPRPVDRPSQFVSRLPDSDRSRLDMLIKLASLEEPSSLPEETGTSSLITGAAPLRTASMAPSWRGLLPKAAVTEDIAEEPERLAFNPVGEGEFDWRSGWSAAPAYDDDHPDELAYRPFALAPLLTETPSFDDPALVTLVHPDAREALAMIDDEGMALPMRFGADKLETAMAWSQAFSGEAVNFGALAAAPEPIGEAPAGPQLLARAVKTQPR